MKHDEPQTSQLSAQAEALLDTLRSSGGWLSRREIAKAIGKARLNPYDVASLELLIAQGRVESQRVDRPGIISYELRYKAKE